MSRLLRWFALAVILALTGFLLKYCVFWSPRDIGYLFEEKVLVVAHQGGTHPNPNAHSDADTCSSVHIHTDASSHVESNARRVVRYLADGNLGEPWHRRWGVQQASWHSD